eukprot:RCo011229
MDATASSEALIGSQATPATAAVEEGDGIPGVSSLPPAGEQTPGGQCRSSSPDAATALREFSALGGSFKSLNISSKLPFSGLGSSSSESYGYHFKEQEGEDEDGEGKRHSSRKDLNDAVDGTGNFVEEVTQAEYNNWFRLFQSFDKDGSGTIDVLELTQVMQALGVPLTADEASVLIRDLDPNTSTLSFDSFLQLMLRNRDVLRAARGRANAREQAIQAVNPGRILSDDGWRLAWDLVLMLITLYYALMVLLRDWFAMVGEPLPAVLTFIEVGLTVFLLADVGLSFYVAYIGPNHVLVTRLPAIRRHYLHTWFGLDLLSALPLDILLRVYGPLPAELVFNHLRLLRLFRLPTLFRASDTEGRLSGFYVHFFAFAAPVGKTLFWFLLLVHSATVVHLFLEETVFPAEDRQLSYLDSLYWVMYTLSTTGDGVIQTVTAWQKLYACALILLAMLFNGVVIVAVGERVRERSPEVERRARLRDTLAVLRHFGVPGELRDEIMAFQSHVLQNNLSKAYSEVLENLPPSMQEELGMYMRKAFIAGVPMLARLKKDCLGAVAAKLTSRVVPPDEFVIVNGEESTEMYFIGHGFASVMAPEGTPLAVLKKGAFFGECEEQLSRGIPGRHFVSVKAVTYCDLFVLKNQD